MSAEETPGVGISHRPHAGMVVTDLASRYLETAVKLSDVGFFQDIIEAVSGAITADDDVFAHNALLRKQLKDRSPVGSSDIRK
jgi:hypothetical protein